MGRSRSLKGRIEKTLGRPQGLGSLRPPGAGFSKAAFGCPATGTNPEMAFPSFLPPSHWSRPPRAVLLYCACAYTVSAPPGGGQSEASAEFGCTSAVMGFESLLAAPGSHEEQAAQQGGQEVLQVTQQGNKKSRRPCESLRPKALPGCLQFSAERRHCTPCGRAGSLPLLAPRPISPPGRNI